MKKTKERAATTVAACTTIWLMFGLSCMLQPLPRLAVVSAFAVPSTTAKQRRRVSFRLASSSSSVTDSGSSNLDKNVVARRRIPDNIKVLILPGFGNDSNDYYLPQAPQGSLVQSLEKRGWKKMVAIKMKRKNEEEASTTATTGNNDNDETMTMINDQIRVLPLSRFDWLQVFWNGAFDIQFWRANAGPTRPAFYWYLQRVATAVQEMTTTTSNHKDDQNANENDDTKIVLVCHSAGGWLARACLGFLGTNSSNSGVNTSSGITESGHVDDAATNKVRTIPLNRILGLVTLGAPHLPPPPQVMDMTRGALRITHETFPGAYHASGGNACDDSIFYITVAGKAVRGQKQERQRPWEPTTVPGFAYNSYQAVLGDGTALGDGVVPVSKKYGTLLQRRSITSCHFIHCGGFVAGSSFASLSQSFRTLHGIRWMPLTWTMPFRLIWTVFFIPLMLRTNGMVVTPSLIHGTIRYSRRLHVPSSGSSIRPDKKRQVDHVNNRNEVA
jgi:hypothetical protein